MKAPTVLSLASLAAAFFLSIPVADARTGTGAAGVTLPNGKKMSLKQDKLSKDDRAYLKKNGSKSS